jgi:hypothetical protein
MNGESNEGEDKRTTVPGLSWKALGTGIGLAIAIAIPLFGLYDRLRNDISGNSVAIARNEQRYASHAEWAERHLAAQLEHIERELGDYELRLRASERAVDSLQTKPDARPDPATGTELRAVLDRVKELEGQVGMSARD